MVLHLFLLFALLMVLLLCHRYNLQQSTKSIKTLFCILFLWTSTFSLLQSQEIRLGIYDGKTFGRSVDNYHYTVNHYQGFIQGDWRQGIGVACMLENAFDVGLLYYTQNTKVPTTFYTAAGNFDHVFDLKIQWLLADFVAYLGKKGVRPFLGSDIGIGMLTLKEPPSASKSSRVKFTWGGNLGIDFAFRKLIAFRIKGDLLYSVKFNSPSPTSSNITAYNSYLQTAISAGIIFRYNLKKKK